MMTGLNLTANRLVLQKSRFASTPLVICRLFATVLTTNRKLDSEKCKFINKQVQISRLSSSFLRLDGYKQKILQESLGLVQQIGFNRAAIEQTLMKLGLSSQSLSLFENVNIFQKLTMTQSEWFELNFYLDFIEFSDHQFLNSDLWADFFDYNNTKTDQLFHSSKSTDHVTELFNQFLNASKKPKSQPNKLRPTLNSKYLNKNPKAHTNTSSQYISSAKSASTNSSICNNGEIDEHSPNLFNNTDDLDDTDLSGIFSVDSSNESTSCQQTSTIKEMVLNRIDLFKPFIRHHRTIFPKLIIFDQFNLSKKLIKFSNHLIWLSGDNDITPQWYVKRIALAVHLQRTYLFMTTDYSPDMIDSKIFFNSLIDNCSIFKK